MIHNGLLPFPLLEIFLIFVTWHYSIKRSDFGIWAHQTVSKIRMFCSLRRFYWIILLNKSRSFVLHPHFSSPIGAHDYVSYNPWFCVPRLIFLLFCHIFVPLHLCCIQLWKSSNMAKNEGQICSPFLF